MQRLSLLRKNLRWRLTLSYTLLTVTALLLAEIALIAALLVSVQFVRRSNVIPGAIVRYLTEEAESTVSPYVQQEPVNTAGLQEWVDGLTGTIPLEDQFLDNVPGLPWQMFILDAERTILAQSTTGEIISLSPGDQFDTAVYDTIDLNKLITAAFAGEDQVNILSDIVPSENAIGAAVPVYDQADNVIGIIVVITNLPQAFQAYLPPLLVISALALLAFGIPVAIVGTTFGFITARGLVSRLERLSDAVGAWSQGDFSPSVQDDAEDELAELTRRMNRMSEQLHYLMETRQEYATVEERNRIARDLHDSAKQQAYAAAAQLGTARLLYASNPDNAEKHLLEAERIVNDLRKELTNLIRKLRPVALQGQGLAPSLEQFTQTWSEQSGIQVDFRVRGERAVSYEIERTFFRIAQEALSNIVRHSNAKQVVITLAYTPTSVAMNIADDGQGFIPAQTESGVGLRSMRERAGLLGGSLTIRSAPGKGALISVKSPFQPEPMPGELSAQGRIETQS